MYHPMIGAAYTLSKELERFLTARSIAVWLCSAWEEEEAKAQLNGTDLILTVGGDGTILRAAQVALPNQTPITGINLGKLGFMTGLSADEAISRLPALLAGEGWIDERAMLEAELSPSGQGAEPVQTFYALNDVVVSRGSIARMVFIEASISGELLTTYKADGVIVASATGSTGYALAAGGPILYPQAKELLLLPIVPHLSSSYPLVLPPKTVVKLHIRTAHQATVSIDGHINLPLKDGAIVTVRLSSNTSRFLRIHPGSFYGSLELKLKGKH